MIDSVGSSAIFMVFLHLRVAVPHHPHVFMVLNVVLLFSSLPSSSLLLQKCLSFCSPPCLFLASKFSRVDMMI